jgi:hypothetical protein
VSAIVPSSPASDHPLGPSDTLCELALALAAEIGAYEQSGGTAIIDDVVLTEPYRAYFDAAESTTGRGRPGWRWEVALRDATHRETVIGEANGGWSVAGVASSRRVDHPRPGSVDRRARKSTRAEATWLDRAGPRSARPALEPEGWWKPEVVGRRLRLRATKGGDPLSRLARRSQSAVHAPLLERRGLDPVRVPRPRTAVTRQRGAPTANSDPSVSPSSRTTLNPASASAATTSRHVITR